MNKILRRAFLKFTGSAIVDIGLAPFGAAAKTTGMVSKFFDTHQSIAPADEDNFLDSVGAAQAEVGDTAAALKTAKSSSDPRGQLRTLIGIINEHLRR